MDNDQNIKEYASKIKLVESGKTLFFKFGFKKVTVDEICREAGLSKMTFYRFFDNKIDLVRYIINDIAEEGLLMYKSIMSREVPFEEKIKETIRMKQDAANQYSEQFLKDMYSGGKNEIMELLQKISGESMALVMEDYRKAQADGFIRKDLNLAFIPYLLNKILEMVNDPVLLSLYGDIHSVMREVTSLFFYGISSNPASPGQ